MRDTRAHVARDEIKRDAILSTLRDDDIGKALRRLDERHVHWPNGFIILFAHLGERPPTMFQISSYSAHQSDVGIGIDEDLHFKARSRGRCPWAR
jgi:hypothetical protein